MKTFLPLIMATITGHPRYIPELKWNDTLWTYNAFRVYETVFGRRVGVRPGEITAKDGLGNVYVECHTWESVIVHIEAAIRVFFKGLVPSRVYIPAFATPMGIFSPQPYLFALAYDTTAAYASGAGSAPGSPQTWTHIVTGSNTYMYVGLLTGSSNTAHVPTACSYNSVDMGTAIGTALFSSGMAGNWKLYNLVAPASGSNTLSGTYNTATDPNGGVSMSFSGAAQSGQPDAAVNVETESAVTSHTMNITTATANAIMASIGSSTAGKAWTAGTNTTIALQNNANGDNAAVYSGANAVGASTMAVTSGVQNFQTSTISIAPFAAAATVQPLLSLLGVGT